MARVLALIGTTKGAFVLESDAARRIWDIRGPFCDCWPIRHVVADASAPGGAALYAGGGDRWLGAGVWRSDDLGASWARCGGTPAFEEGAAEPVGAIWSLFAAEGALYAGVSPAALFVSRDGGESWTHLDGLQKHPTRPGWFGGGAGLILHAIHAEGAEIWVGASAVGVFHSADAGETWTARNVGVRNDYMSPEQQGAETGYCVHALARAAGPGLRFYQQNHCGMYRSDDGGARWESIEAGLPSGFGFPVAAHPRDPDTAWLAPLNGDQAGRFMQDGACAVWRTRDAGASWVALREGLPQRHFYAAPLRRAMAVDALDPAGVYLGFNSGALWASADEGDRWTCVAQHLPTILSVETLLAP
ncbi:WD40/YVTN/BNR-like repeat-containing protein [Rubrimonas cliftonensis]|uniref:BNR/Asp-box repeat-containing protein n=1 Tax=Rubrimonas cliftonensis TaxID=89524 RepID=A0A1H3YJA8_9RHOB|nr:sialidase family protein [Rubrimonas cliftonensis]SEA11630.1 hypothetical protein SAMN05444370_103125 [Rubrimonas cliftonensis]